MRNLTACLLRPHICMLVKSHIGHMRMTAGSVMTISDGDFWAATGYWKTTIMIVAAVFLGMLLLTQPGKAAKLEKGAEVAVSRARQLLRDAERENRNVRPLPLSLAKVEAPHRSA